MKLLGVDGCRAGWVVAASEIVGAGAEVGEAADRADAGASRRAVTEASLRPPIFVVVPTFQALLDRLRGERALVAVDIPIGLARGAPDDDGTRRCDREARAFLGPRRASSVFPAPCRPTLAARAYREACAVEARARGRGVGLSRQAFNIVGKIREVDEAIDPAAQAALGDGTRAWVREIHPEVTFAALAGGGAPGHGLVHAKRGCRDCRATGCPGLAERLALLRPYLPDVDPKQARAELLAEHRRSGVTGPAGAAVGIDDVVDALACLVTAFRILSGQARTLPAGDQQVDARGLRMEIVA